MTGINPGNTEQEHLIQSCGIRKGSLEQARHGDLKDEEKLTRRVERKRCSLESAASAGKVQRIAAQEGSRGQILFTSSHTVPLAMESMRKFCTEEWQEWVCPSERSF